MKKINLLSMFLFFFLVAALALTGCFGGSDDSTADVAVTGVSLNKTNASVLIGGTEQLTATITPSNATNKNVTWTSSNSSVATVSTGGLVSKTAFGTATITVTTEDGNFSASCDIAAGTAGEKLTYTADSVSFNMAYVPGGLTFPTGTDDSGTATVTNACLIGETEVTWELWKKVYDWAVLNSYLFANPGRQGDNGSRGIQHPVTNMNWRDSMVWCNTLTEWYNAQKGTTYECVYTYSSAIIRDSRNSNAIACDGAVASSTANGFRLLLSNEFELAARYRNGMIWTYGDHASGDDSGACYDEGHLILGGLGVSTVFGDYAVYGGNSGSSTAVVKSKIANALGLYDMSGNVMEWCFELGWTTQRVSRGGGLNGFDSSLPVGSQGTTDPALKSMDLGFRFARTQ